MNLMVIICTSISIVMNYTVLLGLLATYVTIVYGGITYRAKFIGNWRVLGDSTLQYAWSVTHCLALCNKNENCDAITFYDELNKCHLFKRCAPLKLVNVSKHYSFYSKRPPIAHVGYLYDENSDSCLRIKNRTTSYEMAYISCAEDYSYLAMLNSPKSQRMAQDILQILGYDEAWVNPSFKYRKFFKNAEFKMKKSTNLDKVTTTTKECWLLQNGKIIKSPLCHSKRVSICQLPPY